MPSFISAETFHYHKTLNPKIWDGMVLKAEVRTALLKIATTWMESWGFNIEVKDIVLTGSNANYNWTKFSDLDLHIIVDMDKVANVSKDFVSSYLKARKQLWNQKHTVTVKGLPVEVYAQDNDELLVAAGVFSLTNNTWVQQPMKTIPPSIDHPAITKKAEDFTHQVDEAITHGDTNELLDILKRLAAFRKAGLAEKGEYSTENLTFKVLRNDGTIGRIQSALEQSINKSLTLEGFDAKRHLFKLKKRNPGVVLPGDKNKDEETSRTPELKEETHKEHAAKQNLSTPCTAVYQRIGGGCYNCGWYPNKKSIKEAYKKRVKHFKGTTGGGGGLSSMGRWKKRRAAQISTWKRTRFAHIARQRPASNKTIERRTKLAARRTLYKGLLKGRDLTHVPYGERRRASRTYKRIFHINAERPQIRVRYKYRRKDTTRQSGVKF